MRWLLFFLVVLNVLAFVWFQFQEGQTGQTANKKHAKFDFSRVEGLTLLSEVLPSELQGRDIRNQVAAPPVPGELTSRAQCTLIGMYPEHVSAKQAKQRLEAQSTPVKVVELVKDLPPVHWVYVKPQESRKKALAILKSLQSNNIDSFLISEGDFENGISLGYFSNKSSAWDTLTERRKQGYDVTMTLKTREQKQYWLAFDIDQSAKIAEEMIDAGTLSLRTIKKQEKSCQEVALLESIE